jgi:hypothetical protein
MMANGLGWEVCSPVPFDVHWPDWDSGVEVFVNGWSVDAHSAARTFTMQAGFIPETDREGDFVWIKALPNIRDAWFTAMDGLIEAWWSAADFGIVCMLNRPGHFHVDVGEPIAQMLIFSEENGLVNLEEEKAVHPGRAEWLARRSRSEYKGKDLDYKEGRYPNQQSVESHRRTWANK